MQHTRQSRPDSGRDFKVEVLKTFSMVPPSSGVGLLFQGLESTVHETARTTRWTSKVSWGRKFERNVTEFALHKALKFIA